MPAVLLFFDLNGFKRINDELGHAEGDHALTLFAECLLRIYRESDVLARLGGDEFAVLLMGTAGENAQIAVERLRSYLDERNQQEARGYDVRFSVGVAVFDAQRHRSAQEFLKEADEAMYRNKAEERSGTR